MAHALGRPVVTGLKGLSVEDGRARCEQEVPGGRDVYLVPLPAVVSVLEGINLPRYPSVPAKLRARQKPVATQHARAAGAAAREAAAGGAARAGQAGGGARPGRRGGAGRGERHARAGGGVGGRAAGRGPRRGRALAPGADARERARRGRGRRGRGRRAGAAGRAGARRGRAGRLRAGRVGDRGGGRDRARVADGRGGPRHEQGQRGARARGGPARPAVRGQLHRRRRGRRDPHPLGRQPPGGGPHPLGRRAPVGRSARGGRGRGCRLTRRSRPSRPRSPRPTCSCRWRSTWRRPRPASRSPRPRWW